MSKSALIAAASSTNNAVVEQPTTFYYLVMARHLYDGKTWPEYTFDSKSQAEAFVNRKNCAHGNLFYSVQPIEHVPA